MRSFFTPLFLLGLTLSPMLSLGESITDKGTGILAGGGSVNKYSSTDKFKETGEELSKLKFTQLFLDLQADYFLVSHLFVGPVFQLGYTSGDNVAYSSTKYSIGGHIGLMGRLYPNQGPYAFIGSAMGYQSSTSEYPQTPTHHEDGWLFAPESGLLFNYDHLGIILKLAYEMQSSEDDAFETSSRDFLFSVGIAGLWF